jgi:hypothetical protein
MPWIEWKNYVENISKLPQEIDSNLDNLEKNEALKLINFIDSEIPWFNIDLTYDEKNDNFYIISWEQKLNIALKVEEIEEIWIALINILNNNRKIWITWKFDFRKIYQVPRLWWSARWKTLFYSWIKSDWTNSYEAEKNNRFVEEVYKFTQKLKWIPEEQWATERWMRQWQEMWNI